MKLDLKYWVKGNVLNSIPSRVINIRAGIILLLADLSLGIGGFMIIEGYKLVDAFYMTVITISTVGYTEVEPLSSAGQVFTSLYILVNIGVFAYVLSVFTYYVIQGEIFKNMHLNLIKSDIEKLSDHVILCGFGKYGKEVSAHFHKHRIPFVIIDIDPVEIESLQKSAENLLFIEEDATHDEALLQAGIKKAAALISALPDDSDNVFTVLTARQLNPRINIISRAKDPKSQRKLLLAGANHVVMPEQIGGFYMATLVSKPGAVEFFSFITNEYRSDIGFEEIRYEDLPIGCKGKSIRELRLRRATGANIIGFKGADGHYEVNPEPETILGPNTSFIVLGNNVQLKALKDFIQNWTEES